MNILRNYSTHSAIKSASLTDIYKLYHSNNKLSMITAHDYLTAHIAESSNANMVLIGDSLAMTAKGHSSTLQLDTQDYLYTVKSILRGINSKFLVADLPFGSFESSNSQCIETAVKLMKLGKINSIKLEGCYEITDKIKLLTQMGIPITGHLGLQPQKFNLIGGYTAQGRSASQANDILKQALHLQEIGCKLLVLECVPSPVAARITKDLKIPTIGIGSGPETSGQVLVMADALGMSDSKPPKFVKQYAQFFNDAVNGLNLFDNEVKSASFPVDKIHTYKMDESEQNEFNKLADDNN